MYLGKLTPQTLIEVAADADPKKQREQQCEAYFYIGEYLLIEGLKDDAVQMFEAAVAHGVFTFYEYHSAKAELTRLVRQ